VYAEQTSSEPLVEVCPTDVQRTIPACFKEIALRLGYSLKLHSVHMAVRGIFEPCLLFVGYNSLQYAASERIVGKKHPKHHESMEAVHVVGGRQRMDMIV
jgi:hypothetical protein